LIRTCTPPCLSLSHCRSSSHTWPSSTAGGTRHNPHWRMLDQQSMRHVQPPGSCPDSSRARCRRCWSSPSSPATARGCGARADLAGHPVRRIQHLAALEGLGPPHAQMRA
jgi:hypothetical protein